MDTEKRNGFAMVFALALMFFCTTIGVTMVFISRQQTKSLVREKAGNNALFLADAGIEYAMDRLKNVNLTGATTTFYAFGDGGFSTEPSLTGITNTYDIISTGYVPDNINPVDKKRVVVRVRIEPEAPPYAVRSGSSITIATGMKFYGAIRSNHRIEIRNNVELYESAPGAGDACVYTATGVAQGIYIVNNVKQEGPNGYYKARGNGSGGTPRAPLNGGEGELSSSCIFDEVGISGSHEGSLLIVENDNSADTDYIPEGQFPFFDIGLLIADVSYATRQTYSTTFALNNQIHEFKDGVTFSCPVTGNGTIWVSSGTQSGNPNAATRYGVECDAGTSFPGEVNIVVTGYSWEADVHFDANCTVNGYIYGQSFVNSDANVTINGVIESGGRIDLAANMKVTYADVQLPLPSETSGIQIISWRQEAVP